MSGTVRPMSLVIGTRLGPYEIVAPLGAGGMGEVYRAHDTRLARIVALKLLTGPVDPAARGRLLDEARAAAALNHPNICTIHEIADVDGRVFIVMEHVDGRLLSEVAAAGAPIDAVIRYGIQITDALAHAHDRGIVHRDLKTANLMLTPDGRVKVLDFGIAHRFMDPALDSATQMPTVEQGPTAGTLAYIAPEVLRGGIADRRADIWAIGVVLYELIAGRRPFRDETTFELSSAILRDAPPPLPGRAPKPLRALVARCLEKDPAQRYQRTGEVRAALEMIAAGAATGKTASRRRQASTSARPARVVREQLAAAAPVTAEKSVIVMPFANLSPEADDAYFSDGLTDELITDLSRVAGLRVAPSAASFRLKKADKDLAAIAREFNVRYIVEGRVRKAGRSIRITAQLIDVTEDRTIWADKYSGEFEHVFELQERVSRAIAEALQLRLQPASRAPTPGAAEALLRGRHFARQATSLGFQKALECFQQATDLDQNYAPAFAALAEVYANLTSAWDALPALEAMPKALAAVQRALELDPTLPEAHVVRALVAMYYEWDLHTAERELQEALRLNPNHADAHRWYAALLIWLDTRYDEALDHVRRAASLDPVDLWIQVQIAWVYGFSRDFNRAVEHARQLVAAEPSYGFGHYALGCMLIWAGRADDSISSFQRGIDLDGRGAHLVGLLGTAYAITGQQDKALACLAELDALERASRNVATWKLHVYVGLGDADQAIRCLEVAVDQRASSTVFMVTHPYLDFVRRDPRFIAVLQRMGLGYLATRTWQPEWKPLATLQPVPPAAKPHIQSLAVLPLENLSNDAEQEYFADGMTEALITHLAQIQGLRVISRTSAMRFKRTTKPASEIARELGVEGIVTGTVLRAADDVRISIQLVQAASDSCLWAKAYERRLVDVLSLQREVATAVVNEIHATTGGAISHAAAPRPVDPEVYTACLKGRHLWHRFTAPDVYKALEYFHAALLRDPEYAPAHAGIAICHLGLGWLGAVIPHQAFPRSKAAALRALDLDESLAEAHCALAYVATFYEWDWEEAGRRTSRALELQPGAADVHLFDAWYRNATGDHATADADTQRALALDPLSPLCSSNAAYLAVFARRYDLAERCARQALELDPSHVMARWTLGVVLTCRRQYDLAIAELDDVVRTWPGIPMLGWLGTACARSGNRDRARELLTRLGAIAPDQAARSTEMARILVALGDHDAALDALEDACEEREGALGYIGSDPSWDDIAGNDRFKAMLRRMGLPGRSRP